MRKKTKHAPTKKVRSRKSSGRTKRGSRVTTSRGSLYLEHGLGALPSARAIAKSIKRAADAGTSVKAASFEGAIAAVDYLIRHLDKQLTRLRAARRELRDLYGEVVEKEPDRRRRMISDERVAARGPRKRGRKLDLATAVN